MIKSKNHRSKCHKLKLSLSLSLSIYIYIYKIKRKSSKKSFSKRKKIKFQKEVKKPKGLSNQTSYLESFKNIP